MSQITWADKNTGDTFAATDANSIKAAVNSKQDALGYTAENTASKNQNGGYPGLDGSGNLQITTDKIPTGTTNLYFLASRVLAVVLTGISFGTNSAVLATDSILAAFGKLQAQLSGIASVILSTVLTGLVTTTNSAALATDTLLVGIGKLQAQINAIIAAGSSGYILPVATSTVLGGVKQGSDTAIAGDGTITVADPASRTVLAVQFDKDAWYGDPGTPVSGNVTFSTTGARAGKVAYMFHNSGSAPTFTGATFVKSSGSYVTGQLNFITFLLKIYPVGGTATYYVIYSISQPS